MYTRLPYTYRIVHDALAIGKKGIKKTEAWFLVRLLFFSVFMKV